MKHAWPEAVFIADVMDTTAAWQVATRFLDLREDSLVGPHPDTPDEEPPSDLDLDAIAPAVVGP
jgi:hypothetical protein